MTDYHHPRRYSDTLSRDNLPQASEYSRSRSQTRLYDVYSDEEPPSNPTHNSSRDLIRYSSPARSNSRHHSQSRQYTPRSSSSSFQHHESTRSFSPSQQHHHHHHHNDHSKSEHHATKDIAATILGGVVGGSASHKASEGRRHSGLATVAGVVLGAWGGHELEKGWEGHEAQKHRRESESRRHQYRYERDYN